MGCGTSLRLTLIAKSAELGSGTSGYAHRLATAWRERGHNVNVVGPFGARTGLVVSLQRVPFADLWRMGGGWHSDAMRAIGRFPYGRSNAADWLAARTSRIRVANSRFVANALLARGVDSHVVRTGVNVERFRVASDEGAAVFIGHGWRRKNLSVAVRALHRVAPDLPLWVAGRDGARRRRLKEARQWVHVRDLGTSIDAAAVLPRARVILHPTLYDPASNLVLEAMASGVPVVTSSQDGSSEILPPGLVAADPTNLDDVVRALRFALEGGRCLGATLRQSATRWPDSRNARELEDLLGRSHS